MKLKRTYTDKVKGKDGYEVNFIDPKDFQFTAVDMTPYLEELNAEKPKPEKKQKKQKKQKEKQETPSE